MAYATRRPGDRDDDRAQARAAFTEFVTNARKRAGLSLEEIAAATKIPVRHLDAVEHGRVADLPRGVYRRAILRTYATAIDLDPALVLERFSHAFGTDAAFSEWESVPPPRRSRTAGSPAASPGVASAGVARARGTRPAAAPRDTRRDVPRRTPLVALIVLLLLAALYVALRPGSSADDSVDPATQAGVPAASSMTGNGDAAPDGAGPTPDAPDTPAEGSSGSLTASPAPPVGPDEVDVEPGTGLPETQLVVTSEPPGARVTVDGIGWGVTPVTIRHLAPGVKRIRITLDGYRGEERDVRIGDEGGAVSVRVALQPRE